MNRQPRLSEALRNHSRRGNRRFGRRDEDEHPELNQKTFRNTEIGWLRARRSGIGADSTPPGQRDQRDCPCFSAVEHTRSRR